LPADKNQVPIFFGEGRGLKQPVVFIKFITLWY